MSRESAKMLYALQYHRDNDEDDEDSIDDESSRSTENTQPKPVDKSKPPHYPSNIAAACHAASTAHQEPKSNDEEDIVKLEKRRKSNRLSAQRWRMRKRSKFSDLQDQIQALKKQHEELKLEKSELQAELRVQLALTQAETAHLNTSFVAARVDSAQRALRLSRELTLGAKLDLISRAPVAARTQPHMAYTGDFPLKVPNHQFNSHWSHLASWPNDIASSLTVPAAESRVSHAELRAMLRDATAPSFTTL